MKVSLNTIKQLIDFELPSTSELIAKINRQLGGIEEVIDIEAKYKGIVIVRVVSAVQHPNADKLTVCMIDDGGEVSGVERNDDGHVQVVCGAPNVREGMMAIWLPPGCTVPSSIDSGEPFVLSMRELRGVVSNGMLAAADELGIGSDHEGIVALTKNDLHEDMDERALSPGQDFAELFGLDDTVIDIENKMFTHRPDCFGQLGVAREIAGISHQEFRSPEWYMQQPNFGTMQEIDLEVFSDAQDQVPRFMAVAVNNITVRQSPFWLQCELVRLGAKPINNVVDITNYFMLLTGQPLHAYDYDKLRGWKLGARMARPGETVTLLDGKTRELNESDIVIADNEGPVGLAGVMGGAESEVSQTTKTIVLECANFDMYTIRRTSMRHGLFTDAVTRFTKGQSPKQTAVVLSAAMECLVSLAGGRQASDVGDIITAERPDAQAAVAISPEFIGSRLGKTFSAEEIVSLLQNVEFSSASPDKHADELVITPPFWRMDIALKEDVVEEVGRLYGFDRLPRELPVRAMSAAPYSKRRLLKQQIRESLARAGANELLTYSFVHRRVIEQSGQSVAEAYQLANALSPDLQYYRLSVLPSLLDKVHGNIKAGHDEFVLFEIGKGHNKSTHADTDEGLPGEIELIEGVYANRDQRDGAPYFVVNRLVTQLAKDLGCELRLGPLAQVSYASVVAPYDPDRSAQIESAAGEVVGIVGEFDQSVLKRFKLPAYTAAFSLFTDGLLQIASHDRVQYAPLSKYPSITNDISLKTSQDVNYQALLSAVQAGLSAVPRDVTYRVAPVSIYQPDDDPHSKTTSFRITFTSHSTTLTDDDIRPAMGSVAEQAAQMCGAELV